MEPSKPLPGPLVDADWLQANLDTVEIADVRWSIADGPKMSDHRHGHLPGAVFVDLDEHLSDPPGAWGRHPLPTVARFRRSMAALGLGRKPTVCYDDASGATAARLWWMLDAIGHPAAVLDGGIESWTGPLETGAGDERADRGDSKVVATADLGRPEVTDWPADRIIDVDHVLATIERGATLLDARSVERFRGDPNPIDPVRGHIPGGRSRPWTDNIGANGRFRSSDELRRGFTELGVDGGEEWLASCGSGVTACHNLLAARIAGLGDGRLYAGSWSEWIGDETRPVETGPPKGPTPPGNGGAG